MQRAKERHVLGLDLVRFTAASMVMVFHFGHDIGPIPLSWLGWVGVEVFFVLSGYVIAASAEGSTSSAFARNRIVRLMPAVWLCSTVTMIVCVAQNAYPDNIGRYIRSLVLWPTGPWLDASLWTLPVEFAFYALVFLCIRTRVPLSWLLRALAVASFFYWALRLGSQFHVRAGGFADALPESIARLSLLSFGSYFALGALMREAMVDGWSFERVGVAAVVMFSSAVGIAFGASSWPAQGVLSAVPHATKLAPMISWVLLAVLMLASVKINPVAWRFLGSAAPAIRLLGLSTYPIYLLHGPIGNALKWVLPGRTPLLAVVLTISLSMAFAATIEPRAQAVLRSLLSGKMTWLRRRPKAALQELSEASTPSTDALNATPQIPPQT